MIICILTYDSVPNSEMWLEWAADHPIAFVTHAKHNVLKNTKHKERLGLLPPDQHVSTAWGTSSLVVALQRLLARGLLLYPRAKHFAFVSGDALPITSAATALSVNKRMPTCFSPFPFSQQAGFEKACSSLRAFFTVRARDQQNDDAGVRHGQHHPQAPVGPCAVHELAEPEM